MKKEYKPSAQNDSNNYLGGISVIHKDVRYEQVCQAVRSGQFTLPSDVNSILDAI